MNRLLKILVIDDEPNFCWFVKKILERQRFSVRTANTGEKGFALAKLDKPDLIFLDMMMPGMCGSDVAILLKEQEDTKNIPVIFLTAIITDEDIKLKSINNIGGYNYMAKPANIEKLMGGIKSVLGDRMNLFQ